PPKRPGLCLDGPWAPGALRGGRPLVWRDLHRPSAPARRPPDGHLYDAACAAARAGCGQGRDAADLDETSRAAFRRQALGWLRADLTARRRHQEQGLPVIPFAIDRWLEVPDFAGVRGPDALARLPKAERQEWQKLWAEVADTLARAGTIPRPAQ